MTNFNWYFTRDEIDNKTPSREDGVPLPTEIRYRKDGARFIINASNTLGLRYETTATGVVFFHRFYMIQSFRQFNRWVVSAACLLLAGKVEETPKKCRDIIKVSQSLLTEQQMAHFGSNPKDELMTHERILLQTIKFDLQVEHPYSYLLKFAKQLKGDKAKIEKLVQMAWTFMNDSLCTTLCLQWEPQAIAIAFIYLAGKLSKFDLQAATVSRSRSWWRQYLDTLDVHDLESICHQVLDIYGEEEQKSGEEAPQSAHPSQATQQSSPHTPQTPQTSHQQHTTATPQPPQAPPALQMSGTPSSVVPQHPATSYQQYATIYQQQLTPTTLPQQPQARAALFSIPAGQTGLLPGTPPLISTTQTTPIPPPNAPLAFSTLNVNVSTTAPSHSLQQPPSLQGTAVPGAIAGSVPTTYPFNPLLAPGIVQTTVSGSPLAQTQRSYGRGVPGSFPPQSFKPMAPLLAAGGGQPTVVSVASGVGLAGTMLSSRPGMEGAYLPAVGRGTSPIPLVPSGSVHSLPRAANILTPQGTFPGAPGSGILAATNQLQAQSPIPGSIRPPSGQPLGGYKPPGGSTGWTR